MKAKINRVGCLFVERAGEMRIQFCPFASKTEGAPDVCGDWCPAFREPEQQRSWSNDSTYPRFVLSLCNAAGDLFFDEIEDERGKP